MSRVRLIATDVDGHTAVCANGALVRDIAGEANTDVFAFPAATVEPLVDAVLWAVPGAGLAWELANGGFGYDPNYGELRPDTAAEFPEHVGERPPVADDMLKLLVRHAQLDEAELLAVLEPVVPPDVLVATYSGIDTVEITGEGVHKARALATLCGRLGIDAAEVVAIGDNRNDVEMLTWARRRHGQRPAGDGGRRRRADGPPHGRRRCPRHRGRARRALTRGAPVRGRKGRAAAPA